MTLAFEDANSKLVEVVTDAETHVDDRWHTFGHEAKFVLTLSTRFG